MKTKNFETSLERLRELEKHLQTAERERTNLLLSNFWTSELEKIHKWMRECVLIEKQKVYN